MGNQNGAVTEALQDPSRDDFEAHGGEGLGHDEQPGLNGGKPKTHLIEQGKEKGNSTEAEASEKTANDGGAKGSEMKQVQSQQGKFNPRRPQAVSGEANGGNGEQADQDGDAQLSLAEDFEDIGQKSNA